MWKHKNFINLQLCAGPIPFPIVVNGTDVYIQRLSDSGETGEETWSYNASINTDIYSISGNTVVWSDGTILQHNSVDVLPTDDIIVGGEYTTRTATPTLTFKHFFDAGLQGTGTYKFRHYSQQEPSTGETWVLNETLQAFGTKDKQFTVNFTFDGVQYTGIKFKFESPFASYLYWTGESSLLVYNYGDAAWAVNSRAIVFDEPVTDSTLLAWLQENGTKQGVTLINFTINNIPYRAEEGMTWEQWVNSGYNTAHSRYFISDGHLKYTSGYVSGPTSTSTSTNPYGTDCPQPNGVYTEVSDSGGSIE